MIFAPRDERIAMIVVGTRLKQQHPKTASVIISAVAELECDALCIFLIAFMARGVAAFDIPSTLELIHAVISSVAISFLNDVGKMCTKIGRKSLDIFFMMPASLRTFITPLQNAVIPMREITKFTLLFAPSISAVVIEDKLDVKRAKTVDIMQMKLKHFPNIIVLQIR